MFFVFSKQANLPYIFAICINTAILEVIFIEHFPNNWNIFWYIAQKMNFSIKDFFIKRDQIRSFLSLL